VLGEACAGLFETEVAQGSQDTGRLMMSIAHWAYTMRVCKPQHRQGQTKAGRSTCHSSVYAWSLYCTARDIQTLACN
jgi:hypothetical protein